MKTCKSTLRMVLLFIMTSAGCGDEIVSSDTIVGEPTVTASPGSTLTLGISTSIETGGGYGYPSGTIRLSWRCTGSVSIEIDSQFDSSSQQCVISSQSVSATGPGTITVELGDGATLAIIATGNQ